jgi:hypothetical protein
LLRLVRRHAAVRPQVTFRLLCMAGPATVRPCVLFESIRLRPFASGVLIRSMATRIDDPVLQTTTHVRPKSSTRAEVYHTPRHQNVAARRATARLSKPARAERARSRLPDALLWSLKFAENLSFRSASVAPHTHTSSPLANCPTTDSHCDGPARVHAPMLHVTSWRLFASLARRSRRRNPEEPTSRGHYRDILVVILRLYPEYSRRGRLPRSLG